MSHQYYLHRNPRPCEACQRDTVETPILIGHSGGGWVFLWRGWRTIEESPFDAPVLTPGNWRTILHDEVARGAVIKDSYGHQVELDVFLAHVVAKRSSSGAPVRRHSDLGMADIEPVGGDDIAFRHVG